MVFSIVSDTSKVILLFSGMSGGGCKLNKMHVVVVVSMGNDGLSCSCVLSITFCFENCWCNISGVNSKSENLLIQATYCVHAILPGSRSFGRYAKPMFLCIASKCRDILRNLGVLTSSTFSLLSTDVLGTNFFGCRGFLFLFLFDVLANKTDATGSGTILGPRGLFHSIIFDVLATAVLSGIVFNPIVTLHLVNSSPIQ